MDPSRDTIVAIATPPGLGALSIVRVSGPNARSVFAKVFFPDGTSDWPARTVRHGVIRSSSSSTDLDDGLAWWAPGPGTFTGEDTAEFTGHGGSFVTARVLESFLAAGARAAEPGEFTRRAFLNGRMDLARAEAVADVISAATDDALRIARAQLGGGLSAAITRLRDEVLDSLAHVEATVDFPDEDLHPDGNEALALRFDAVASECARLAASYRRGRLFREGARVVLAGRPNVGKSSLLNALAGRDRAIVTDQPGTTRDVVEEAVDLGGIPVTLADTAGIRDVEGDGAGAIEREGIRRSREAAATADLVLVIFDGSEGFGRADRDAAQMVAGRPAIFVANKSDLPALKKQGPPGPMLGEVPETVAVRVSAVTRSGLDELVLEMKKMLLGPARGEGEDVVVTRARHREALDAAETRLRDASAAARRSESPDLVASDARRALDALGAIVGVITTEDLLGRIFERFCVGK